MASFSERIGEATPKLAQFRTMDAELRASLWNVCKRIWFSPSHNGPVRIIDSRVHYRIAVKLYEDFYKTPIDEIPRFVSEFVKQHLAFFMKSDWHIVYTLVEFLRNELYQGLVDQREFDSRINDVLEREKAAYRFLAGVIAPLTNEIELEEVASAATRGGRFSPVANHIRTAVTLFAQNPHPDYRNSVKESISAVESAAKLITNQPNATLGEALKVVNDKHPLHGAFRSGISSLYGYTSGEGGIRHGLMDESNIDEADARYMLVSCSAFANYLISRSE